MNLRQKAKHFKRLYEAKLKKPYPIIYKTNLPHYKILQMVDARDIVCTQDDAQLRRTVIENRILQKLRPLIWENLKIEKDLYSGNYKYSLDIWVEPPESEEKLWN